MPLCTQYDYVSTLEDAEYSEMGYFQFIRFARVFKVVFFTFLDSVLYSQSLRSLPTQVSWYFVA